MPQQFPLLPLGIPNLFRTSLNVAEIGTAKVHFPN